MLDLKNPVDVVKVEISKKTVEFKINKIFLDPSGRHLLINSVQGETLYLYRGWKKPKPLKRFTSSKLVIDSVAWNRHTLFNPKHSMLTGSFLVGTRGGAIYEACLDAEDDFFKSQEKLLKLVFNLPDRQPATGIMFENFPPSDGRKCLVILTTPSRIYQFTGVSDRQSADGSEAFTSLFSKYRDLAPGIVCMPSRSVSHIWR